MVAYGTPSALHRAAYGGERIEVETDRLPTEEAVDELRRLDGVRSADVVSDRRLRLVVDDAGAALPQVVQHLQVRGLRGGRRRGGRRLRRRVHPACHQGTGVNAPLADHQPVAGFGRSLIQTTGFLRKEIVEVARQPRLLLVLVLARSWCWPPSPPATTSRRWCCRPASSARPTACTNAPSTTPPTTCAATCPRPATPATVPRRWPSCATGGWTWWSCSPTTRPKRCSPTGGR
ncbi:MAG: hypothetical protein R2755_27400 [Acidimicrobiales bacterium]